MVASNAHGYDVVATDLWQKTTAMMTDAVNKNLNVHKGVSESLGQK